MLGRHIAAPRRRRSVTRMLSTTALAVGVGVLFATASAGGTYAFLSSSASSASAATLKAGTAEIAVTTPLSVPATVLHPGLTVVGTAAVKNTGTTPLQLRVAGLTGPTPATPFSSALSVGTAVVANTTACTTATAATWSGTFASAPAGTMTGTVAPGAIATVCVRVTLSAAAPQNASDAASAPFTLLVNGRQVR